MRVLATVFATATLLLGGLAVSVRAAPRPPELAVEGPPRAAATVERLRALDREDLVPILELVGLDDPGPPIRVVVAPEGSPAARRAPSWSVAYAVGSAGLIVLMPGRIPTYPDDSLESVLRHEIAHVLIARAAGRRPVPRWFNEGLAIHAARSYGLGDHTRLVLATLRRGEGGLARLDEGFLAGPSSAAHAYALSTAFVRYFVDRYGERAAARVLAGLSEGLAFDEAFRRATGSTLAEAEDAFWRRLDLWNRWLPFLTSSAALWMVVTALALWAFKRRRERDAERLRQWRDEEIQELGEMPTDGWVH